MKRILFFLVLLNTTGLMAQSVEVQIFQNAATATTAQIGIRARTTSGTIDYIGVTFYLMYQSVNAQPQSTGMNTVVGVDDSKLVTTFNWGTSTRFTNPAQLITPAFDPAPAGGQTYDSRYIYGNSDQSTPANTQTLTTSWDTLLYVTLNTLQINSPQGGNVYLQETTEAMGTALTDPSFANIPISVTSGEIPIGLGTLPVLFTKFEAGCTTNGAIVKWSTASEINTNYFELQHSTNGNDWTLDGTIKAAENSSVAHAYQLPDFSGGLGYYRIRQVDIDGNSVYTSIIKTNCEVNGVGMVLYPVPARDILNVVIRSDKALKTQLLLFDGIGKLVKSKDVTLSNGSNSYQFNLKGLAGGQYIIRSNVPGTELNKTFNILR